MSQAVNEHGLWHFAELGFDPGIHDARMVRHVGELDHSFSSGASSKEYKGDRAKAMKRIADDAERLSASSGEAADEEVERYETLLRGGPTSIFGLAAPAEGATFDCLDDVRASLADRRIPDGEGGHASTLATMVSRLDGMMVEGSGGLDAQRREDLGAELMRLRGLMGERARQVAEASGTSAHDVIAHFKRILDIAPQELLGLSQPQDANRKSRDSTRRYLAVLESQLDDRTAEASETVAPSPDQGPSGGEGPDDLYKFCEVLTDIDMVNDGLVYGGSTEYVPEDVTKDLVKRMVALSKARCATPEELAHDLMRDYLRAKGGWDEVTSPLLEGFLEDLVRSKHVGHYH